MQTIEEGKEFLRKNWEKGVECPCCKQFVKRYRRPMHAMMAVALIGLYKAGKKNKDYHHISEFAEYRGIGDFAKLRYWDLVEEKPQGDERSKRSSGFWRITEKGQAFIENKSKIQSHILLFNGKYFGHDGDEISIRQVLKKKFNYEEIMGDFYTQYL